MSNNEETIRSLLVLLDEDGLRSISKTILSLLPKTKELSRNEDTELFYKILNGSHDNRYPPLSVMAKTIPKLHSKIITTVTFLNNYMREILDSHNHRRGTTNINITRKHKITMYGFFIDIMAAWFTDLGIPNTLKSIINNHDKFPALLNKQFPGYKNAGLLVPFVFDNVKGNAAASTHTERTASESVRVSSANRNTRRNA